MLLLLLLEIITNVDIFCSSLLFVNHLHAHLRGVSIKVSACKVTRIVWQGFEYVGWKTLHYIQKQQILSRKHCFIHLTQIFRWNDAALPFQPPPSLSCRACCNASLWCKSLNDFQLWFLWDSNRLNDLIIIFYDILCVWHLIFKPINWSCLIRSVHMMAHSPVLVILTARHFHASHGACCIVLGWCWRVVTQLRPWCTRRKK